MTEVGPGGTLDTARALPKVVLHDHLDGGLRADTLLDLAEGIGHELSVSDPDGLQRWFVESASGGSLPAFLETFAHTVACLQTEESLARAAREAVVDHASDGVVYAEIRYAPELHTAGGLSMRAAAEAVAAGLADGVDEAAREGNDIVAAAIATAMRQERCSVEVARLVIDNPGLCAGFDIAGPEAGFPPSRHAEAFTLLREALVPVTVHAGEAAGPESIGEALSVGSARRIGHGIRVLDDVDDPTGTPRFGRIASFVRDNRIPLEVCPTSNVQTGAAPSVSGHPISLLRDLGFAVTVNPDNRLMCGTTASREMALLMDESGWSLADLEIATLDAAWAAFQPYDVRQEIADAVVRGFGEAGG